MLCGKFKLALKTTLSNMIALVHGGLENAADLLRLTTRFGREIHAPSLIAFTNINIQEETQHVIITWHIIYYDLIQV